MSVELFESVMDCSLHMPLQKPSKSSTPVEFIKGSVLVGPPSKEGQLPIIFGKAQLQRFATADSSSDSDTPQFFHYARPAHHTMRKMGYDLQHGKGLNFGKGRRGFLRSFVPRGKPANYYDNTRRGWDTLHPHRQQRFNPNITNQSHHTLPLLPNGTRTSVWEWCSKSLLLI